jgi:hypothetical protein
MTGSVGGARVEIGKSAGRTLLRRLSSWPAGARRRTIVGMVTERLHQERGRPSADGADVVIRGVPDDQNLGWAGKIVAG